MSGGASTSTEPAASRGLARLLLWEDTFIGKLRRYPELHDQLIQNMMKGINVRSFYSGVGTAELSAHRLEAAIRKYNKSSVMKGVVCLHACDKGEDQQKVLVNCRTAVRARHVFAKIEDRLTSDARFMMQGVPTDFPKRKRGVDSQTLADARLEAQRETVKKAADMSRYLSNKSFFRQGRHLLVHSPWPAVPLLHVGTPSSQR